MKRLMNRTKFIGLFSIIFASGLIGQSNQAFATPELEQIEIWENEACDDSQDPYQDNIYVVDETEEIKQLVTSEEDPFDYYYVAYINGNKYIGRQLIKNVIEDIGTKRIAIKLELEGRAYYSEEAIDKIYEVNQDINSAAWSKPYIQTAYRINLLKDTDLEFNTDFKQVINRKDFASILYNYIHMNLPKNVIENKAHNKQPLSFKDDVNEEVLFLSRLGIIKGSVDHKGNRYFNADDNISRQEVAVLIDNTESLLRGKLLESNSYITLKDFKDVKSIPNWSKQQISNIVNLGLMNGRENKEFDPTGIITKEETIKIFVEGYNTRMS